MISLLDFLFSNIPTIEAAHEVTQNSVAYTFPGYSENQRSRLIVLDKTIIFTNEQYMSGVNKHSGATWERWAALSTTFYSFKQEREGVPLLRIYSKIKRRNQRATLRNTTSHSLSLLFKELSPNRWSQDTIAVKALLLTLLHKYADETGEAIPETMEERKRFIVFMAYPVAKFFPTMTLDNISSGITQNSTIWRGTTDIKEYVRKNFGVEAVRKDMVKALTTLQNPISLEIFSLFKNLVPVDWFVMLLRNPEVLTNIFFNIRRSPPNGTVLCNTRTNVI